MVGLLRPFEGRADSHITVEESELLIGRSPDANEACPVALLADESVSRVHAKIIRENDDFVLLDLDSRNGTYVDGVPIVSCVLRDGDAIQIGRNLFYFDRLYELVENDEESPR